MTGEDDKTPFNTTISARNSDTSLVVVDKFDQGWIGIKNDPNVIGLQLYTSYSRPRELAVVFSTDDSPGSAGKKELIRILKTAGVEVFSFASRGVGLQDSSQLNDAMLALKWPGVTKERIQKELDAVRATLEHKQNSRGKSTIGSSAVRSL